MPHIVCVAQRHDNHWVLGYDRLNNPTDTVTGTIFVNFDNSQMKINYLDYDSISFDMWRNCVSMSDVNGNLIFYTNGISVLNGNHKVMAGSDDYNYHPFHDQYNESGLPTTQGSIALPAPEAENKYYLIHGKINLEINSPDIYIYITDLYYSIIDMNKENGLGELTQASIPIANDTLENFGITAVRHANGRDWWVVAVADEQVNKFYVILIDQYGPHLHHIQDLSSLSDHETGVGQVYFSNNGELYVRNIITLLNDVSYLDVFNFDRCTGMLAIKELITYSDSNRTAGLAISHNGRFAYANDGNKLYQFDLSSENIASSMNLIDEYDGFRTENNFPTTFRNAWLAPDGRIYMTCNNGMKPTHVIHHPNRQGKSCEFVQRAFNFPRANANSIPNHPNYRLGPIDGSPCDTLGIDNMPLARWRHDASYRFVEFTNLSDYEPTAWYWSFGDGQSSTDTSPYHTYLDTGWYEVCLAVSNMNGADTFCRIIHVTDSLSAIEAVDADVHFAIYPNPATDYVHIISSEHLGQVDIQIYDLKGKLVIKEKTEIMANRLSEISLGSLYPGFYILEIWKAGIRLGSEKLIVQW